MAEWTTRDGTRLHYECVGEGRPPFVFVHGWCSRATHWQAQVRHFETGHRVLAVDRRGHGESDAPVEGYHPAQHAADLEEVADALDLEGAVVVGHAGGAPSALAWVASHPIRAKAVVLVDTILGPGADLADPDDPAGRAFSGMLANLRGADGRTAFEAMYRDFFGPIDHQLLK